MDSDKKLNLATIDSTAAISVLGLVVARSLQASKIVVLQVNSNNDIEIVPYNEICADRLSIDNALIALVNQGYTDIQLSSYLAQRDARSLLLGEA